MHERCVIDRHRSSTVVAAVFVVTTGSWRLPTCEGHLAQCCLAASRFAAGPVTVTALHLNAAEESPNVGE